MTETRYVSKSLLVLAVLALGMGSWALVGHKVTHPAPVTLSPSGLQARAIVWDNGPGIPRRDQGRIFDAFFTTKPVGMGSGLGLSISREILQRHGGELSVESDEGRGSRFIVTLPAAASVN